MLNISLTLWRVFNMPNRDVMMDTIYAIDVNYISRCWKLLKIPFTVIDMVPQAINKKSRRGHA